LLLVLAGLLTETPAWAQQAIFVVRHAERVDQSRDSALSVAGQARAAALARHLRDAGVTAAFVTDLQRTQQTAAPLAAALGLTLTVMPAAATAQMVERIRRDHPQDVVLVVGHSNTVPEVLKLFGDDAAVTIRDDEYDALFVVVPRAGAAPVVLRLRF
jgi:broad specificity phosphatase PhoE